jgi:TonB family protein
MKLSLSLIITTIISGNLFAQTTRVTNEDKSLGIREKYYVLKSDKNIKEGAYAEYAILGDQLVCEGSYKNNLRDSIWNYYNYQHKLAEFGKFENGEKIGVWNVFDSKGGLQVQYDYTNKKLLAYNRPKSDSANRQYYVINGNDTIKTFLGRPPIFLDGGVKYLTGMHYPRAAKENNIQGKVLIGFTIDSNGKVSNFRIKKSLGYGCDEEALRAAKNGFNGDWLPGLLNGNSVVVEYEVPIGFTLRVENY